MTWRIINADVLEGLRGLPDESVHCCVTSPPYWGLRDYGTATWEGSDPACDHFKLAGGTGAQNLGKSVAASSANVERSSVPFRDICRKCGARRIDAQLGLETVLDCLGWATGKPCGECYICRLTAVFAEVRRVLRGDATAWLNVGSGYASDTKGSGGPSAKQLSNAGSRYEMSQRLRHGLKPKDECMVPARLALALQASGWYLRSQIPWVKRNSMPESVTDRPSTAVEYVYLLSKSQTYYYDLEAIRAPDRGTDHARQTLVGQPSLAPPGQQPHTGSRTTDGRNGQGRNRRNSDSWFESWQGLYEEDGEPLGFVVNPVAFKGAHFACWPPKLVAPMIRAGTSQVGVCATCGSPWTRVVERNNPSKEYNTGPDERYAGLENMGGNHQTIAGIHRNTRDGTNGVYSSATTLGWRPSCTHPGLDGAAPPESGPCDLGNWKRVPATVIDPFGGSGSTALVADRLGRDSILLELSEPYCRMAERRLREDAPLFSQEVSDATDAG